MKETVKLQRERSCRWRSSSEGKSTNWESTTLEIRRRMEGGEKRDRPWAGGQMKRAIREAERRHGAKLGVALRQLHGRNRNPGRGIWNRGAVA